MQQNQSGTSILRNLLLTICYDGKNYHGWQIQKNAITVQGAFQDALYKVLGGVFDIKGCSRTDTGVHANMYCLSIKTDKKILCKDLIFALNRVLPFDICVRACREVPLDFHARYSCKGKEYVYKILNSRIRDPFLHGYALHYWYPLDISKLQEAGKYYLGKHDFTSFCTIDKKDNKNIIRNVRKFEIKKDNDMVEFYIEADGFLYNMVRIMIGTLLRVCQGKIAVSDMPYILDAKDRSKAGPTAPACGLYLNRVFYDI